MENGFQEGAIAFSRLFLLDLVDSPRGPSDHRRVHIAEIPFVSGELAVGMLVPLAQDDIELALREMRIDQRERDAMEREVPRRIPGKFPFVWHRHHPLVVKVAPLRVAPRLSLHWRRRLARVTFEPILHNIIIKLFRPKHARQRLAVDQPVFFAQAGWFNFIVKLIRLEFASFKD